MNVEAVIGANYGDEGKGLVTDYLCLNRPRPIVILNNGGSQRGHTVELKDSTRHVFHHFGSGTLRNAPSYFTYNYYLNPMEFIREHQELSRIVPEPIISYHHPKCIIQMPSDIAMNWFLERERARNGFRHGSVGCGIWETTKRMNAGNAMAFDDFCKISYSEKVKYVNLIAKLQKESVGNKNIELFDIFMNQGFIDHFIADCMEMSKLCPSLDSVVLKNYETLIFENGQGLMLDEMFSNDTAHSTPSRTGSIGVAKFLNSMPNIHVDKVILNHVTRPYITRHGNGEFEGNNNFEMTFIDNTNVENEWQGKLRYGKLDIWNLLVRVNKDRQMFIDNFNKFNNIKGNLWLTHFNEYNMTDHLAVEYISSTKYADDIMKVA